jgi:type III pantothenate kinase
MTMIRYVVDIGNSGLRCVLCATDYSTRNQPLPDLQHPVHRLHWITKRPDGSEDHFKKVSENSASNPLGLQLDADDTIGLGSFLKQGLLSDSKLGIIDLAKPIEWCVSSVYDQALKTLESALREIRPRDNLRRVTHSDVPMPLEVDVPDRLGIDRLLAAFGAYRHRNEHGPVISIQAGTAVTVDLVSESGRFTGGAILPGMGLALSFLGRGTSKLPWLSDSVVQGEPALPGKNTEQAIIAGVHASVLGGALYLVNRYRTTYGGRELLVVVSGGDGQVILPHIPAPTISLENLVLRSLEFLFAGK